MKKLLALMIVSAAVMFCHVAGGASPSNLDWLVSNITSEWKSASVDTSTVDRLSMPPGVPHSGWSDAPTTVKGGDQMVSVPPYLFVQSSASPEMAIIPTGRFLMGAGNMFGYFSNAPSHYVDLLGFSMDIYEVSWKFWDNVRSWSTNHGYPDIAPGQAGYSTKGLTTTFHPVVDVSWYDCLKWCNARSEKEGLTPVYYVNKSQTNVYRNGICDLDSGLADWSANGYRLPTEAEWEKASRGGLEKGYFSWGNYPLDGTRANYYASGDPYDEGTTPVGYYNGKQVIQGTRKVPDSVNRYGLYDMAGNVYEWCWDWYGELSTNRVENPRGPVTGAERIIRGGCWKSRVEYMLFCVKRTSIIPAERCNFVGFRCVKGL